MGFVTDEARHAPHESIAMPNGIPGDHRNRLPLPAEAQQSVNRDQQSARVFNGALDNDRAPRGAVIHSLNGAQAQGRGHR